MTKSLAEDMKKFDYFANVAAPPRAPNLLDLLIY